MKYIKLKKIKLKGLRSFIEEQEISVPEEGLIGIKGISGSGKTNLHLAIAYAFGYCPISQSKLQSWEALTNNKLRVELEMDTYLGPVTLVRGEDSYIDINGKVTNASAKAIGQELQNLVGIPLDLVEALTFRSQGTPARFMSMTDSEKKEFLSKILNLESVENEIEESVKRNNKAQEGITKIETVVNTLKSQVVPPEELILAPIDSLESTVASLEVILNSKQKELEAIEKRIKEEEKAFCPDRTILENIKSNVIQLQSSLQVEENDFKLQVSKYKVEIAGSDEAIKDLKMKVSRLPYLQKDLEVTEKELNGLLAQTCPTCSQSWIDSTNKAELLGAKIQDTVSTIKYLEDKKQELLEITAKHELLVNTLINFKNPKIDELKEKIKELQIKEKQEETGLLDQTNNHFNQLYREYSVAKDESRNAKSSLLIAKNQLDSIINSNRYKTQNHNMAVKQYDDLVLKINKENDKLQSFKQVWQIQADYIELLKSFIGVIFEEILHDISVTTNEILRKLPNVENKTIHFVTEKVTNKGTIKQEIKPMVMIHNEAHTLDVLSGGQRNSVGLAIDLAISSVIVSRTGYSLDWQVFDESFDGMDLKTKESCLELLKEHAKNKVIFTIDHFSEINEMYQKVFLIEMNNDISTIKEIENVR